MNSTLQTTNRVSDEFESGFIHQELEWQVKGCDKYWLTPLFLKELSGNQPVLEAGCGSGRWMHYFKRHGIEATGIDWSPILQKQSRDFDPLIRFDTGDLRALPYADNTFGGLIALGSPEHVIEGPQQIFREFYRVLKPGGVGIITVPHLSLLRSICLRLAAEPLRRLKRNNLLRRLAGRSQAAPGNPEPYSKVISQRYRPDIYLQVDFDGYFYEYQFTKAQITEELAKPGFSVERVFAFDAATGLICTLGRMAGRLDKRTYRGNMTLLGKLILRLFSEDQIGHMLCTVVRKPTETR